MSTGLVSAIVFVGIMFGWGIFTVVSALGKIERAIRGIPGWKDPDQEEEPTGDVKK